MKAKIKLLFKLFRAKQWIKNLFVFAPMVFAGKAFDVISIIRVTLAVILFCLLSSCIYILNDIVDLEKDKCHPKKKLRPIASGEISPNTAVLIVGVLLPIILIIGFYLDINFEIVLLLYILNNCLYSHKLKNMVILDVISIAVGFLLRVIGGAEVIAVYISPWILMCTLFLALFLGFSKRRNEIVVLGENAGKHRTCLQEYSLEFIDSILSIVISTTVMAYSLYTFFSYKGTYEMILTIPVVIYGIFRYQYLVYKKDEGGSPEETILSDKPLMIDLLVWVLMVMVILYL